MRNDEWGRKSAAEMPSDARPSRRTILDIYADADI